MEKGKKETLIDLESLSIKEMFAHIIQRLDRDKEVRKKEYEKLTREVRTLKSEVYRVRGKARKQNKKNRRKERKHKTKRGHS